MLLAYKAFNAEGYIIQSNQTAMPEYLDWASIDEKAVYFGYMGGLPEDTAYCLITSQGGTKLLTEITGDMKTPNDRENYIRKQSNVEQYLQEECKRLGINRGRHGGNQ